MRRPPLAALATLALVLAMLILSGCFSSFIAPDSAARPDQDVVIINNNGGCPFCVRWILQREANLLVYDAARDGQNVNPLRLMPGRYHVSVGWLNVFSGKGASVDSTLDLRAGHTYTVHLTDKLWAPTRVWITGDTDGGRIVGMSR